jgi:predicted PurR-regulated permease PerM
LFGFFGILLALPAAAIVSVLAKFAFQRYLAENPDAASTPAKRDEES